MNSATFTLSELAVSSSVSFAVSQSANLSTLVTALIKHIDKGGYLMYKGKRIDKDIYSPGSISTDGRHTILFGCLFNS